MMGLDYHQSNTNHIDQMEDAATCLWLVTNSKVCLENQWHLVSCSLDGQTFKMCEISKICKMMCKMCKSCNMCNVQYAEPSYNNQHFPALPELQIPD